MTLYKKILVIYLGAKIVQKELQCYAHSDHDKDHDRDLDSDSDVYIQTVLVNRYIADEVIQFYESFEGSSELVYSTKTD